MKKKNCFTIGDIVLVIKPKNVGERPSWLIDMDKFNGTYQKISEIYPQGCIGFDSTIYNFSVKWLRHPTFLNQPCPNCGKKMRRIHPEDSNDNINLDLKECHYCSTILMEP